MQQVERIVYVGQVHVVGNVLIHLDFLMIALENFGEGRTKKLIRHLIRQALRVVWYLVQVLLNKPRDLGSALEASESCSLPDTASHKLEWPCGDLLARSGHTNNDRGSPALQVCPQNLDP